MPSSTSPRPKTPPSLLSRAPVTKESNFWKRRCNKEDENVELYATVELPWLEAASKRPLHVTGRASSFTLPPTQPSIIPASRSLTTHDKVVERSGSPRHNPNSSSLLRCGKGVLPNGVTASASYLSESERFLALGAQAHTPQHQYQTTGHQAGSASLEQRQLVQRIAQVEAALAAERQKTDFARKALHAACYKSATCGQSATWHMKESSLL